MEVRQSAEQDPVHHAYLLSLCACVGKGAQNTRVPMGAVKSGCSEEGSGLGVGNQGGKL